MQEPKELDLEKKLNTYFEIIPWEFLPFSGYMIHKKARKLALSAVILTFAVSKSLLQKFKDRYNIGSLTICGETNKVPQEQSDRWLLEKEDLINSYAIDHAYNCDKTGIFYDLIPDRIWLLAGQNIMAASRTNFGSH